MGEGVLIGSADSERGGRPKEGATGFWRPASAAARDAVLYCDGIPVDAIATEVGTPVYIYSAGSVRAQYRRLSDAFAAIPHRIHYSAKANGNLAVLALLRELGAGVDIVSGGELHRAVRAGHAGRDIVFSGVGKTAEELHAAIDAGVKLINVESADELHLLDQIAAGVGRRAPVAVRVNPEVTVETPHAYTRTGERGHKFGIPYDDALDVCRRATGLAHLELVGLDMHLGSQITEIVPYVEGVERLLALLQPLRAAGAPLRYLDAGGGLAVPYGGEASPDIEALATALIDAVRPTGLELILEPGRYLVANAGVLVTRVLYRKRSGGTDYVITDAGMNDLLRPSHYQAYHHVDAVVPREQREVVDIVGPVCESGDFLALDREITRVIAGDLLAVHSAGAYGFVMSSNYNARRRPAEVMVDGARYAVVGERESYDDLVRHEPTAPSWRGV